VRGFDRAPGKAKEFAAALDGRDGMSVQACDSAEAAVRGADILVTSAYIEPVRKPLVEADWLAPGCLAIVLDHDAVLTDAALRAFNRHLTDDAAQFAHAQSHEGAFAALPAIEAEIADLVAGRLPARQDDAERIAALRLGLGLEDLAAAVVAREWAQRTRSGIALPL
jgi:ornithine cyclodeaminase/alanine dehydrogenase-like protein (mu-crystallin family)